MLVVEMVAQEVMLELRMVVRHVDVVHKAAAATMQVLAVMAVM